LETGKVAIGSLEDKIIERSSIYFCERSAIKVPEIEAIMHACTNMEKRVEKMPKKLIDKKFLKNSGFFIP